MPTHYENTNKSYSESDQITELKNSYRLEANNSFKADEVEKIVKMVMHNNLEDVSYNANECSRHCNQIATEIRKRIQKLNFDRSKIVVVVTIAEKASQSIEATMGILWDTDRDNCITHTCETLSFVAYCCVFGAYYE